MVGRVKKFLVMSAAAVAVLAGCGGSTHKSAPPTPSTSAVTTVPPITVAPASTTVPAASTTTSSSSTVAPSTTTTGPAGPRPCLTADLTASLGAPNGAAGTIYYQLRLTNKGGAACTLAGYPGVSFVAGASGAQVGAGAARTPGNATALTLAPGQSASSALGIAVASNYGSACQITDVAGLRVYPPGQTTALFVPHSDQACANQADVLLHVGPLGTATG